MFGTLQSAFGTWPSDKVWQSAVNERFDFGDDGGIDHREKPPSAPKFVVKGDNYPSGKVFVPPFFVPPGHASIVGDDDQGLPSETSRAINDAAVITCDSNSNGPDAVESNASGTSTNAAQSASARSSGPLIQQDYTGENRNTVDIVVSPSLQPGILEREIAANWSDASKRAFQTMVTSSDYVNRYRLSPVKRQGLTSYLLDPSNEPLNADGTKDHHTKYQAAHWTLDNGHLYRKPDSGRIGSLRRHLGPEEAWDALTTEHVKHEHMGRDKLRKVLEKKYIGYSLKEIMFVLKECKRCNGKGSSQTEFTADIVVDGLPTQQEPQGNRQDSSSHISSRHRRQRTNGDIPEIRRHGTVQAARKGPFTRTQTSNFMMY